MREEGRERDLCGGLLRESKSEREREREICVWCEGGGMEERSITLGICNGRIF